MKLTTKDSIISLFKDGQTIMVGGFMAVGTSETLISACLESGAKDLTIICNDGGYPDKGVGRLIAEGRVKKLITSHIGLNPMAGKMMSEGTMEVQLVPQGSLAEKIRAGGAGLGGVITPVGIGTMVEEGKEKITLNGVEYLIELPLKADIALIASSQTDESGNTMYYGTARNFNPMMATAAKVVIVSAREVVASGALDKNNIATPHIFVDYIVKEEM